MLTVILGQIRDRCRGQKKGACLRRRNRAPSSAAGRYLPKRSVGVRRKAPGAHAETEQMSTARTRVRGVTTKQRRELAKRDGLTDGILR